MKRFLVPVALAAAALLAPHAGAAVAVVAPCPLFDAELRTDPILAPGVTVTTPAAANFFAAGSPPKVSVSAASTVPGDSLSWTVRDRGGVRLSTSAPYTGGTLDLALPTAVPGLYEVDVRLLSAGVAVGASCLRYGVGMPGAQLDPAGWPAGRDWGGAGAARDVALHAQLGVPIVRRQLYVADYLADPNRYVEEYRTAAAAARALGVSFVVQIGGGGLAERQALSNGTWESLVRDIVTRHRGLVPYWEAWNEPNTSYFYPGNLTHFVTKTLVPFARAVRAADPAAKVVGASTYGVDPGWWTAFGKAGGFRAVDIVSVHAYAWATAYEGWMVADLKALKTIKDTYGGRGKPIWDTESGYKSNMTMRGPWVQADWTTRKLLWQKTLGIRSGQFLMEGGWEDWPVIDQNRGMKPAALALSALDTLVRGRAFAGWVPTSRGVYAAKFGPRAGGSDTVTAVWTTGQRIRVPLTGTHLTYDEMGAKKNLTGSIIAQGDVHYVVSRAGRPAL